MPAIIRSIAVWMNFTPIFIPEPNNTYGMFKDGTWSGLKGMLFRNEADISMSPIIPESDFMPYALFTNPVAVEKFATLSTKISEEAGYFLLFNVFRIQVWIGILFCLCLIPVIIATVYCKLPNLPEMNWFRLVIEYIWTLYSYMMQQARNNTSKWILWGRSSGVLAWIVPTLMMLWIIGVAFLAMNTFASGLSAMLTIAKRVPVIDTMMDLINKKHIQATTSIGINLQVALKDSGMPIYDWFWERIEQHQVPDDQIFTDLRLTETEEGKVSLVHGYLILQSVLDHRFKTKTQCNFHLARETFFTFPLLCPMKNTLPKGFLEKFNYGMTRLFETDIPGKWFKPSAYGSNLCLAYVKKDLNPLNMKNVFGVFALWAAGIVLAFLTLLLEMLVRKRSRQKNIKTKENKSKTKPPLFQK